MALDEWDRRRGREGRRWRELVQRLCQPGALCEVEWCDKPTREIAFGLRRNHPMGPSLDHVIPLDQGGHPTAEENLRPAHFGCNSARGNRDRARRARPRRSRAVVPVDHR